MCKERGLWGAREICCVLEQWFVFVFVFFSNPNPCENNCAVWPD